MRRENNKIVEKGLKKIEERNKIEKGEGSVKHCTQCKKKGLLAFFDYFKRFLSNQCVFDPFCLKPYLVSDFIASNYESRVLIDPC